MATPNRSTAEIAADETPAPIEAATPYAGTAAARAAELKRQAAIVDAVADADLSSLGGPLLEPGLGR